MTSVFQKITSIFICGWAILGCPTGAFAQNASSLLLGNTTYSFQLCDPAASSGYAAYQHYFHLLFDGPVGTATSNYHATVNGTQIGASPSNRYDTPILPAGTQCSATITMSTSNVPTISYTGTLQGDVVAIGSCYIEGGLQTCPQQTDWYVYFVNPVSPTVSITPNTTITTTGAHPVTVKLFSSASGLGYANQPLTASCATQYGAQVSVSPLSATTDIVGNAAFTITATQLAVPVPGGTPSATCTFKSTTSGNSATVSAQGTIVQPLVSLNPSTIAVDGSTAVSATISPVYSGVQIDATCTTSLATITLPASVLTNASGVAVFNANATGLVTVNANTAIKPSASCTFQVHGGTGKSTLTYTTYNACALSLMPKPPACGNPP